MIIELGAITLAAAIGYVVRGHVIKNDKVVTDKKVALEKDKNNLDPVPRNVSEPVTSFVRIFKNNPRRFSVRRVETSERNAEGKIVKNTILSTITDKHKGLSFSVEHVFNKDSYYNTAMGLGDVSFLTQEEIRYVFKIVGRYNSGRKARYSEVTSKRARRGLINVYKEEM